jgi:RING-variant domain
VLFMLERNTAMQHNKLDYGSACCQQQICREESCRVKEPQSPTPSHHPEDATCRICLGDAEVRCHEVRKLQLFSTQCQTPIFRSPRASTTQGGKLCSLNFFPKSCTVCSSPIEHLCIRRQAVSVNSCAKAVPHAHRLSNMYVLNLQDGKLFSPCKCAGSMKYVHVECLQRWRAEASNKSAYFRCEQCRYRYNLRRVTASGLLGSPCVLPLLTAVIMLLGETFHTLTLKCAHYNQSTMLPNRSTFFHV